jgi:hypothetical protein
MDRCYSFFRAMLDGMTRNRACAWCGVPLPQGSAVPGYLVCSQEHADLYWATIGM